MGTRAMQIQLHVPVTSMNLGSGQKKRLASCVKCRNIWYILRMFGSKLVIGCEVGSKVALCIRIGDSGLASS